MSTGPGTEHFEALLTAAITAVVAVMIEQIAGGKRELSQRISPEDVNVDISCRRKSENTGSGFTVMVCASGERSNLDATHIDHELLARFTGYTVTTESHEEEHGTLLRFVRPAA